MQGSKFRENGVWGWGIRIEVSLRGGKDWTTGVALGVCMGAATLIHSLIPLSARKGCELTEAVWELSVR